MKQVLGAGALGRPRGMWWGGRQEGGLEWGIHVNPWLIHENVWQKLLQYCKVISLKLIKINGKKKNLALPLSRYRVMWTCPLLELLQVKYSKVHHKQPTEGKPVLPYASIPAGKSNRKRDGLGYNCSTLISTFPHLNSSHRYNWRQ